MNKRNWGENSLLYVLIILYIINAVLQIKTSESNAAIVLLELIIKIIENI